MGERLYTVPGGGNALGTIVPSASSPHPRLQGNPGSSQVHYPSCDHRLSKWMENLQGRQGSPLLWPSRPTPPSPPESALPWAGRRAGSGPTQVPPPGPFQEVGVGVVEAPAAWASCFSAHLSVRPQVYNFPFVGLICEMGGAPATAVSSSSSKQ